MHNPYDPMFDQRVNYVEGDWDRTNYGECDPCAVRINDLGRYQCEYCRGLLGTKVVKDSLASLHGELWRDEYEILKKIRRLVNQGQFDQLQATYLGLRHNNGVVKTYRLFYDLKHTR